MLELGIFEVGTLLSSCFLGSVVGCNAEGTPRELGRLLTTDDAPVLEDVPEGGWTTLGPWDEGGPPLLAIVYAEEWGTEVGTLLFRLVLGNCVVDEGCPTTARDADYIGLEDAEII